MGRVRLCTYREYAAAYRVTPRTVRRWANKGAIAVVRVPSGRPRVVADDADIRGHSGHNEKTADARRDTLPE